MEDCIVEQEEVVKYLKKSFSQLAPLANGAIEDIPKMVSNAKMIPQFCDPPQEIKIFINHCK